MKGIIIALVFFFSRFVLIDPLAPRFAIVIFFDGGLLLFAALLFVAVSSGDAFVGAKTVLQKIE